jgi:hypothetical protein
MRMKYLKQQLALVKERLDFFYSQLNKAPIDQRWFIEMQFTRFSKESEIWKKKIAAIKKLLDQYDTKDPIQNKKTFNLDAIKQIPIDQIVDMHPNTHKFKIREERTPSCFWYVQQNRWWDFGANEGGDIIDLYQKIHSCSFYEACIALETYI